MNFLPGFSKSAFESVKIGQMNRLSPGSPLARPSKCLASCAGNPRLQRLNQEFGPGAHDPYLAQTVRCRQLSGRRYRHDWKYRDKNDALRCPNLQRFTSGLRTLESQSVGTSDHHGHRLIFRLKSNLSDTDAGSTPEPAIAGPASEAAPSQDLWSGSREYAVLSPLLR